MPVFRNYVRFVLGSHLAVILSVLASAFRRFGWSDSRYPLGTTACLQALHLLVNDLLWVAYVFIATLSGLPQGVLRSSKGDQSMHLATSELIQTTLLIAGALFPIVVSPENIPIFLTLTAGISSNNRSILARKIAINVFALLLVSVLIGTHILAFFGISLPVVQVGGGLIVVAGGWKLLTRVEEEITTEVSPKPLKPSYLSLRAFYPLTLPLTVGPGAISVAIAVGVTGRRTAISTWALPAAAIVGCAVIAILIYLSYRFAEPIGRMSGETALSIISRLSSFILLCIGVQIMWNGASALLKTLL